MTSIAEGAFLDCPTVASITVDVGNPGYESPDNCNAIIEKASHTLIAGCKNMTIPNSVTSIGGHAFCESGLTSISIPASVVNIGGGAFFRCENLSGTITIPNSVTSIGQDAFYGCKKLSSMEIPDGVASIGSGAYYACHALTSIHIPRSVVSIAEWSALPTSVSSITVDADNPIYDSRNKCNAVIETATNKLVSGCKNTIIPKDVVIIGDNIGDLVPPVAVFWYR